MEKKSRDPRTSSPIDTGDAAFELDEAPGRQVGVGWEDVQSCIYFCMTGETWQLLYDLHRALLLEVTHLLSNGFLSWQCIGK